jgi:hypothetical protein
MIPGCGHMYLGYMKRGAQFMAMFAASLYSAFLFMDFLRGLGVVGAIFIILLPIIWFYQMFDAMHTIAQLRRYQIEYPEDDGFFIPGVENVSNLEAFGVFKKRRIKKAAAAIFIGAGGYVLLSGISNIILRILRSYIWSGDRFWSIYHSVTDFIPPFIISLILIFAGLKLWIGKK